MIGYFYQDDKKEKVNENLLTDKALSWATSFLQPKSPADRFQANPKLTSAQLRRFHIEAKTLEERCKSLKNPDSEFAIVRPLVKMLKSKAAYACPSNGRDRKVPAEFRQFIEEMVDHIEDYKDFKAFALCFEAVVGFFYGEGGR